MSQNLFWPPFLNRISFFKFYFKNVNVLMFSYFEPNFIEKFHWESGFSNFDHVTIFREMKIHFLAAILKRNIFLNVLFADLWLF